MNDQRWIEVKEILGEILDCSAAERSSRLDRLCGEDTELRGAVESLLQLETRANNVMNSAASPGAFLQKEGLAPETVGPYRILREIGRGGMGLVYWAQQVQPIRRDVALKIIKPGMDSEQVIERFESERQALAMMDHSNIARVFDAGTTSVGLPYFVMELVNGIPITQYCDTKRLTINERIELFILVCRAIHHAHQKGVIHRDIKPSNILVAEQEGEAIPKVIDFGLAKALGQPLTDATKLTNLGTVVGTPEYMSPEQAGLTKQDVDTRTDVYSLGVVLYELLTGMTPLEAAPLARVGYLETLEKIRDEDVPPPSARLRRSPSSNIIAEKRQSEATRLCKQLHGELDWIAMKAIEKDRLRRYETVNGLLRDLEHYLAGEPIEAVPLSAAYRTRKFVQRHRLVFSTAALFILLLVAGLVVSTWMAVRARRAEQEAKAVNDFLRTDLLAQASPNQQGRGNIRPDPDLKVRTALDRAAGRFGGKFASQPLLEASIRQTIGETYRDLGLYAEAQRHVERALELRMRTLGEKDSETLSSAGTLGLIYLNQGRYAQAEPLAARVLALQERLRGPNHPDTLRAMVSMAMVYYYQSKYAKADSLESRAVELSRRILGDENPETLQIMVDLATTYNHEGKYSLAEPLEIRALEIRRRVFGSDHPETLLIMNNLASGYLDQGKYALAEPLLASALDTRRKILGEAHPDTLQSMNNLGLSYADQGKYAEAEQLYSRALELRRRISGEGHLSTLILDNNLADLYRQEGKYTTAEVLFQKALAKGEIVVGSEHWVTLGSREGLGDVYQGLGNYDRAARIYAQVYESRRRVLGEGHPDTTNIMVSLGRVQFLQQRYRDAESTLSGGLRAYERANSKAWQRYFCENMLGASLAAQKRYAEAEPLLLSGYNGMLQRAATMSFFEHTYLRQAGDRIVTLYQSWGRVSKAAEWRAKLQSLN